MKVKYQSMLLVFIMLFSLMFPYSALAKEENSTDYNDIKGHWAEKELRELLEENIITGSLQDGKLVVNPNIEITRAEFFTTLIRSLGATIKNEDLPDKSSFNDVGNHWAKSYIELAKKYNITNGYQDGSFKPNQSITRAEAVTALVRAYHIESSVENNVNFSDVSSKNWAYSSISIAVSHSLVNGYKDNTFRPDNKIKRGESFVLIHRAMKLDSQKEKDDEDQKGEENQQTPVPEVPVIGGGGGGIVPQPTPDPGNPTPTPTPTLIPILVNEVDEGETYTTNEEKATLTGKIQIKEQVQEITASYQPIYSETTNIIEVDGTTIWSISDIPLEIGSNIITIKVKADQNKSYTREVVINRVNEIVEFADNVQTFNVNDANDMEIINEIANNIINYSTDDMGTPYDTTDDLTILLVNEDSPLVESLKNNELQIGDIISIPPTEQFLAGWTFMIQDYGEPSDFINYPPHLYEEIYVITPGLADLFQGDISLDFSGQIDLENPVAFSIFPEGVEIVGVDEYGQEEALVDNTPSLLRFSTFAAAEPPKPGIQWGQLKTGLLPSFSAVSGDKLDIMINFGGASGVVIYDHDGNLDDTKNDQVKISGQTGIKNLSTTAGIEWHPNFNPFDFDVLPQQIIFKTTYDKVNQVKAEFSAGLNLENVVKNANKALNSNFENKHQFIGMDISGIDFKDQIALGALGLRLDIPPTYATLGGHQVTSKIVGFSPILLIIPVIDITGKLEAKLSVSYTYNSYVETGVNIQKKGFTGAYGPLEANRGQKSIELAYDRQLEIYDLEAKSKSKKDEKPVPVLIVEGSGTAEASFGVGVMTGLMLNGVIPAAVKGSAYARAKATLNGTAKWEDSLVPTISGSGQLGIDVGVRLSVMAKLQAKTTFGSPGFSYKHDWEYRFIDYNLVNVSINGTVKEADGDYDLSNNPSLSDVKVSAQKVYSFNIPAPGSAPIVTTTDSNGAFKLNGATSGKYKITFTKDGYITYTEIVNVGTSNASVNVVLAKANLKTLSGKVLIADNDTNMSNNTPLADVKLTAKKLLAFGSQPITTTSAENGDYSLSGLSPGLYEITAKKSNYVTITQNFIVYDDASAVRNLTLEMVEVSATDLIGIATGDVIDALTGLGISDIVLNVRMGINATTGSIVDSTITNSDGSYSIELAAGNYTIEAVGNGSLHSAFFNIKIEGNATITNQNGVMTPIIPDGQIRVILRWGETPTDLDSHLVGPKADGTNERFHIMYSNKSYMFNSTRYADLDVDDITSWGPETITIYQKTPGKYRYFVHDYTNRYSNSSWELANSGAFVEVYTSESASPVVTFYVPYEEGNAWAVFEYDSETGNITAINNMLYGTDSFTSYQSFRINDISNVDSVDNDFELIKPSLLEEK